MYVKGYKSSIFKFINDVVLPEFAQQGDIKVVLINPDAADREDRIRSRP